MHIIVSSIVEVSMNKIALRIRFGVDGRAAERVIIASNVVGKIHLIPLREMNWCADTFSQFHGFITNRQRR